MNILLAGYGQEGEASYRYWSSNADNKISIADEKQPQNVIPDDIDNLCVGPSAFDDLDKYDLIIRTAGLTPRKLKTKVKVWSATNEFFKKCPSVIIGVTGSKGKGTTASLIASILRADGKKVWLVGNIGKPALDVLEQIEKDDYVVYELSSFQLWDLEKSPHIATILHIEQEHLDVHKDMADYVNAKAQITRHQNKNDVVIYNASNQFSSKIAGLSKGVKTEYPGVATAHVEAGNFKYGEQIICSTNSLKLIGNHNLDNACAAIDAVWNFDVSKKAIRQGLEDFTGLPHRLQFVKEVNGVRYYDDSIATTPSSAIAAIKSFDCPKTIILGGSSKGSDFSDLAREVSKNDIYAILVGQEATKIKASFDEYNFKNYEILTNQTAANMVKRASEVTKPGGVVLLSPASASFGLFKNYVDRGEQYIAAVEDLKENV